MDYSALSLCSWTDMVSAIPVEGPLIQKSITSEAPNDMKFYYQWRSNIAVGASLVIDFCISGPSTGNSNSNK